MCFNVCMLTYICKLIYCILLAFVFNMSNLTVRLMGNVQFYAVVQLIVDCILSYLLLFSVVEVVQLSNYLDLSVIEIKKYFWRNFDTMYNVNTSLKYLLSVRNYVDFILLLLLLLRLVTNIIPTILPSLLSYETVPGAPKFLFFNDFIIFIF